MPKLDKKTQKRVEKAEPIVGGNFEPLPVGKYVGTLSKVEAQATNAGGSMWVAEFTDLHSLDGTTYPGRQWYNLNLPDYGEMPADYRPKRGTKSPEEAWEIAQSLAEGRLKAFFEAFGYTVDSDTDEMIGERCLVHVGRRTIQQGPRKGEITNQVNGVEALPDDLDPEDFSSDEDDDQF